MDILNDAMQFGLECYVSKGLPRLDFECPHGDKFGSFGWIDSKGTRKTLVPDEDHGNYLDIYKHYI